MDAYSEVFEAAALLGILFSGVILRFSPQTHWINRACGITTDSEKRQNLVSALTQGPADSRRYQLLLALHPRPWCCQPAERLITHRYTSASAPALPLPDCATPGACGCAFRKTIERRRGERRTKACGELGFPDRRKIPDRRTGHR
jgi:hypothetical protein